MPVACTRCGEKQEGEILNVNVCFKFPHRKGCGQGIGPLAIIKGQIKKPVEISAKETIIAELKPQIVEAKKEKKKVFGGHKFG